MLRFRGSQCFRQRLVCATVTGRAIRIDDIRADDQSPGLRDYEASLLRLLEKVTNGCIIEINETGAVQCGIVPLHRSMGPFTAGLFQCGSAGMGHRQAERRPADLSARQRCSLPGLHVHDHGSSCCHAPHVMEMSSGCCACCRRPKASPHMLQPSNSCSAVAAAFQAGTSLRYKPGFITGGGHGQEHDCGTARAIGYFLEPLALIALWGKKPLTITLRGVTNDNTDCGVDVWRTVTFPLLRQLTGVEDGFELKVGPLFLSASPARPSQAEAWDAGACGTPSQSDLHAAMHCPRAAL